VVGWVLPKDATNFSMRFAFVGHTQHQFFYPTATTDQTHMFETMEIANPRSLSLILTPCDLIVKTKNLPGKARNEINMISTRSKRLKLTHN
jgi:hypothetical protein